MRFLPVVLFLLPWGAPQEGVTISGRIEAVEGETQRKLRADVRYVGPGIEKRKDPDPSPAVVYLLKAPGPAPAPVTVDLRQDGLEFRPRVLAVPAGSTVRFPNEDDLFHNVFSYSRAKRFDLGRYPRGQSREVVFDQKGLVEVRCDIHKHMRAYVHVFDHPHFAVVRPDGSYELRGVPPGAYTLAVWKEFFEPVRREIRVGPEGARVDVTLAARARSGDEAGPGASCCGGAR
jgi:plastocyanin